MKGIHAVIGLSAYHVIYVLTGGGLVHDEITQGGVPALVVHGHDGQTVGDQVHRTIDSCYLHGLIRVVHVDYILMVVGGIDHVDTDRSRR